MTTNHDDLFILKSVNDAYSSVAGNGSAPEYAVAVAKSFGYSVEQLESVPEESHMGLGCGNPTVTATLKTGETVLDLGSGGGIDIFLAASKIGHEGKAIGLDMSAEMVKRARRNAAKHGLYPPQVSFVECLLTETLPIASNSIDCVLSNCVINLLPPSGKNHIFQEVYRVLKPGGRLVLDDILAKEELPDHIRNDMTQYVSCIGGAVQVHEYRELLQAAGFKESMFIDSLADLNVYIMAAQQGSDGPSCCGCTTSTTCPPQDPELDLNRWAASYQIYTRKPDEPGASVCDTPLKRWWDAFPPVQATQIPQIAAAELAIMLKSGESIAVIHVQDKNSDAQGRIVGSHKFPAQTFHNQLAAFHTQFSATEAVVFYSDTSPECDQLCAGWYKDYLNANSFAQQNIFVLGGGLKSCITELPRESGLAEVCSS
ncbi:S-adenosyl-L-methionine-dependent methyltransferase [Mycena vitilis]|nr:S-adenosyl-L-methionine-dependent methyltransferase [Mycena vitilis]